MLDPRRRDAPALDALDLPAPDPAAHPRGRLAGWLGRLARPAAPADGWALWQRACAGDAAAATALVHQLTPQALGLTMQLLHQRADAEDVVQESFLRLWRSRPDAHQGATLGTYFNTIVINRCRSLLTQRRELATEPEALTLLSDSLHQAHPIDTDAAAAAAPLRAALQSLPPRQRMALAMWAYADATVQDIAAALEIDTNAAHQLLHRARHAMRQRLAPRDTP